MKIMKKYLAIFAMAATMICSCQQHESDNPEQGGGLDIVEGEISLTGADFSDGQIVSGPTGGDYALKVSSSDDWRVSGICDWTEPSAWSGKNGETLTFKVQPNDSDAPRSTVFKVFTGDAVASVTIVSNPTFVVSLVSDADVQVSSDAETVNVTVESNAADLDVNLGGAEWLSVNEVSDVFGKKSISIDVARSSEFKDRETVVTISGVGTDQSVNVNLTQAQRDTAFVVEGESIIKGIEAFDQTLNIRSNVDVSYSLPSWLSETSATTADKDDTGLQTRTIQVHADACGGSRASTVEFISGSNTVGSVYIKQQNPNPVYVTIKDEALASILESNGWILTDPQTGKTELLEAGLNGTSLTVNNSSVEDISGLDAFPNLSSLSIGTSTRYLTNVDLGSCPITSLSFSNSHYFSITSLTVAGTKLESLTVACNSYYIRYGYDSLETLDVTGCPALTTLNATRQYNTYQGPLSTIYMTQAQSESVTVTKHSNAQIVVK